MDEFKNVAIFIVCLLAGAMLAVGAWRLLTGLLHKIWLAHRAARLEACGL